MWATTTSGIPTLQLDADEAMSSDFPEWSAEEALAKVSVAPGQAMIIDLSTVPQARSQLFGYIAVLKQLLHKQSSRLVIVAYHHDLQRTFEVLGLYKLFKIVPNLDEAVSLCKPSPAPGGAQD